MRATIERVRAEFLEMPGLRLTVVQMRRLCGVDATLCQDVLDALVGSKFLRVNADGTYARVSDGDSSHWGRKGASADSMHGRQAVTKCDQGANAAAAGRIGTRS
jgi:hypothetical protein